jgi:hypothetical protein
MNDWEQPQRLERLLQQLAARAERIRAGEALPNPRLTLHLHSGRDLQGVLLGLGVDGGATMLSLLCDTGERFNQAVTHVPLGSLEAITVHEINRLEEPVIARPIPSKLELRRAAKAWQERLQLELHSEWRDDDLEPLSALLEVLGRTLEDLLNDPMGREALRQKIRQVRLEVQAQPEVKLEESTLVVATVRAISARVGQVALRSSIEKLL